MFGQTNSIYMHWYFSCRHKIGKNMLDNNIVSTQKNSKRLTEICLEYKLNSYLTLGLQHHLKQYHQM